MRRHTTCGLLLNTATELRLLAILSIILLTLGLILTGPA